MPFVEAYKAEIEDDNEEFAHLENDDYGTLNLGGNNVETEVRWTRGGSVEASACTSTCSGSP